MMITGRLRALAHEHNDMNINVGFVYSSPIFFIQDCLPYSFFLKLNSFSSCTSPGKLRPAHSCAGVFGAQILF